MSQLHGLVSLNPSVQVKAALQAYILQQRLRQKEEAEQSAALHEERKAREEKIQRDSASLGQVKEQTESLRKRMEQLQQDRHELFTQLKKVLNQEDEQRKRIEKIQQEHARDSMEILSRVGRPQPLAMNAAPPPPPPPSKPIQPSKIVNSPNPHATPVLPKRGRSPSPKRGAHMSPYYSSPSKLPAQNYQRSPYPQHYGPPPAKIQATGNYSPLSAAGLGPLPPPPPPPRMQGMSPSGLPVVPAHKQVGGITSGFPVQKSSQLLQQQSQQKTMFSPNKQTYTQRYF